MVPEALREAPELVAIGGSAGAIDVLTLLLPAVPKNAPPVVVVLHLSPRSPSLLSRIFGPRCQGVCMEIEDKTAVERGHVYFAPPGYHVLLEEGDTFALSVDEPVHHSRPSIDVFFESVARTLGSRALGIALTGANQDGAAGLMALHQRGARTVVQSPESAKARSLPMAALALHTPTFSGPPEAMATFLAREVAEGAVA
jgi:two-component system chemotaxis response regulator CheB